MLNTGGQLVTGVRALLTTSAPGVTLVTDTFDFADLSAGAEAEALVMKYAKEYWDTKQFGRFPRTYARLYEAWGDHDLWGSTDSRWELEEREVVLPDRAVSAARG